MATDMFDWENADEREPIKNMKSTIDSEQGSIYSALIDKQIIIINAIQKLLCKTDGNKHEVILDYSDALKANVEVLNMFYGLQMIGEIEFVDE